MTFPACSVGVKEDCVMTSLFPPPASEEELEVLAASMARWLASIEEEYGIVEAVERDGAERRWYLRLRGEEKDFCTIWMWLDQRTFRYETYFMPAPVENREELFSWLLRRNGELYGAAFCIGEEDAVYLKGAIDVHRLDRSELDRIVGTLYTTSERFFRPAMRMGFGNLFKG